MTKFTTVSQLKEACQSLTMCEALRTAGHFQLAGKSYKVSSTTGKVTLASEQNKGLFGRMGSSVKEAVGINSESRTIEKAINAQPRLSEMTEKLRSNVYSHVTGSKNVGSILDKGLDPDYGGEDNGLSVHGKRNKDIYVNGSRNYIHIGHDPMKRNPETFRITREVQAHYRHADKNIATTVLSCAVPEDAKVEKDPNMAPGSGAYRTHAKIPPENIVPVSLPEAFRKAGTIGADYAPEGFVNTVMDYPDQSYDDKVEYLRAAIHNPFADISSAKQTRAAAREYINDALQPNGPKPISTENHHTSAPSTDTLAIADQKPLLQPAAESNKHKTLLELADQEPLSQSMPENGKKKTLLELAAIKG